MPEEWFDVAYINFDKVILHGRVSDGFDEFRCRKERMLEQVLTEEQKNQLIDMNERHQDEMQKLLRSFVSE